MATTGCAWKITGFMTERPGDDFDFANVDTQDGFTLDNEPVSAKLGMSPISTTGTMTFKMDDTLTHNYSYQGLLGAGLGTGTTGSGEGSGASSDFRLDAGWVFMWGMRPGGRTRMVRAYAAHTDFSMRMLSNKQQIFLRSSGERDMPPLVHSLAITCLAGSATQPPLTCAAEPCTNYLEVTAAAPPLGCTFALKELNPIPDTSEAADARAFVDGVKARLQGIATSSSPLPNVPPG